MEKERIYGLDLVRVASIVFVITEHFFLNNDYYGQPLCGETMALATWIRMLAMSCTPMFMMLSGYLCVKKQWKRGYLRGLLSILVIWLLSSVLSLALRRFRLGEQLGVLDAVRAVVNFTAVPYGWYVEMYLGLYLLMPFINAGWNAAERSARRFLLLSLLAMTFLPTVTNVYKDCLPDWWIGIYPIAYYILGAWLKEYPLRLKRGWLLLGWLGFAALAAVWRWCDSGGDVFRWSTFVDRNSALVAAQSVCLFSLLSRSSGERSPALLVKAVRALAKLSLPIYLASYLTDSLLYPMLRTLLPLLKYRLLCLPVILPVNVALSALIAWAINAAAARIVRLIPGREELPAGQR